MDVQPIRMPILEGELNENEEKEYLIEINNKKYKIIIVKDYQNIEFKICEINKLQMYYYYNNKYSLKEIIDIFKLNKSLYKNTIINIDKVIEIIDNSYLNKKISINIINNDCLELLIYLSFENSKEYKSTLILNKKEEKIEKKFEIIINEISSLKLTQKGQLQDVLKNLENKINDIKNFVKKKIEENIDLVKSLKSKIKNNEDSLKENKNIINSLKVEINNLNKKINDFTVIINSNKKNKENKNKENIKAKDIKLKEEKKFNLKNNNELKDKLKTENNNKKPKENNNIKKIQNNIILAKNKKEEYKIEKIFDIEDKTALFFSIILLGDTFVGKSWIFDSYFSIPFTKSPSICLESEDVYIKINNEILSLNIEDAPGQERFTSLLPLSKKDLIIFVYSIDNKNSFDNIKKRIKEIKKNSERKIHYILVGNKMDLNIKRVISKEEGSELAKSENLDFFIEASAKTGENIENIFFEAAKILYKK